MNSTQPLRDNPVVIKSLTVKVGKRDIVLSMKDAEELRDELNRHLGCTPLWPAMVNPQIVYVDRVVPQTPWPQFQPYITCGDIPLGTTWGGNSGLNATSLLR